MDGHPLRGVEPHSVKRDLADWLASTPEISPRDGIDELPQVIPNQIARVGVSVIIERLVERTIKEEEALTMLN